MTTERLPLTDARRKTALATVTAHRAGGFVLDRSIYHAADARYHHRQPCDKGHALVDGSKLKVTKVGLDRGVLVHRTPSALPPVGGKAQLHLDADRREQQARAHTLLHVLLAALAAEPRVEHAEPPEVVGGGEVKLHVRNVRDLAKAEARARQFIATRAPVEVAWMPRDEARKRATPQHVPLDAVAPEEPTLRMVRVGDWSLLPCDAPLVEHVWQVGDVRFAPPQPTREGARWRARVL